MSGIGSKREFTGWHMLAIMIAFFSVIIAVNLTMAFMARSSWTGMVVDNVYVASRQFNEKAAMARAQAELGWRTELAIAHGRLDYRLLDSAGKAVRATQAKATFRRPAYEGEDQEVTLLRQPDGSLSAPVDLRDGQWIVQIDTDAGLEHTYRDTRRVTLRGGIVQ